MADTDYLILLYSPDCTTILTDPIGPSPYELRNQSGTTEQYPFYLNNTPGWRSITLSPRFNQAGMGSFVCNATVELLQTIDTPEVRVAVIRDPDGDDAVIEMAGPLETYTLTRDAQRDGTDGLGQVTVTFSDDLASLATRLVYPNPAQASTGQTTTTKYAISSVNAEDAARALVNLNASPGALTARKFPELVLGTDHGVGTTISASFTRSVVLTDALRYVLFLGGNLGMRTFQSGETAVFEVYQPRDLSASVWFSWELGNIRSLTFESGAPTATVAIVGDTTAGTARVVKERSNSTALTAGWRRKEVFVDGRSAANAAELEQLGDKAVQDAGPTARVSVVAIDTPQQRYRTDYGIGDTVSVEVFAGKVITDIVRGVDITVTPDKGEVIAPLIGADDAANIDLKATETEKLKQRLTQLEDAAGVTP